MSAGACVVWPIWKTLSDSWGDVSRQHITQHYMLAWQGVSNEVLLHQFVWLRGQTSGTVRSHLLEQL